MTLDTLASLVADHWVLILLVLCPIVIVTMALAALNCEACGAPFGIFRRRNRTIDLCIRCALVHDFRQAKETRDAPPTDRRGPKPDSSAVPTASSVPSAKSPKTEAQEDRRPEILPDPRLAVR
ncbi:MAG: hypothetical protein ABI026_05505 [Gemmatimonadaceae bacterium]